MVDYGCDKNWAWNYIIIMSYKMGEYRHKSLRTCRFKDGCPVMDGSSTPWVGVWLDETNAVGTNYPDTNQDGV